MMGMTGIEGYVLAGRGLDGSRQAAGRLSRLPAIHSRNDQNIPFNTHHTHHWIDTGQGWLRHDLHRAIKRRGRGLGEAALSSTGEGSEMIITPHPAVRRSTMHSPVGTNCVMVGSHPNEPVA